MTHFLHFFSYLTLFPVLIGIVQQIHTESDPFHCLQDFCSAHPEFCKHREEQFSLLELTHQLARGPIYARYLQHTLIKEEEYCMQIDSHMDFIKDWDVNLMDTFGQVNNEYAVLSSMPLDISAMKSLDKESISMPHLCQPTFKE
jgi:hypothetical protein